MSTRAVGLFMLLILLICVAVSGCSMVHEAADFPRWLKVCILCGLGLGFVPYFPYKIYKYVVLVAIVLCVVGCAALPMPLQPANEQYNSNMAEGGFIVLAAVDTAQTMHIRRGSSCDHEADPIAAALYGSKYPKPGRVLVTNLALITVHTMVTSWLDDKVAQHDSLHDGSVGPWYVGRVVWHGVSLFAEGAAVVNNRSRGCAL